MDEEVSALHIASFLEHDDELNTKEIMYNLETVLNRSDRTLLECHLRIVDGEYLTVRVEGERDPSECFDLCYIDDVHGYSWTHKGAEYPHLFVFRFLARTVTDGEAPNEVHIFSLSDKRILHWVIDIVNEGADNAKRANKQSKPRYQPTRTMSRKKDAISQPERIKRHARESSIGGTKGKLEELNQLFDEIEGFENLLHDAVSFQVTGANKVDRSLWRDSLTPPSYEAALAHVERIRNCINVTADLKDHIKDPGPGELLNRLFESLWWVQKICDGNRVIHYDPNLVRSVWRPAFTDRTISALSDYLQAGNKSFWQSLGDAWTVPGGKPDNVNGDFALSTRPITVERSGFKPEMTIKDYGYYKPMPAAVNATPQKKEGEEKIDIESFISGVRARGGTLVIAKQKNVSEAARELSVNVGDILEVLDDSSEWCCLRTPTGQTGHVPRRCIEVLEENMAGPSRRSLPHDRSKSPREKKISISKRSSATSRKFKKAPQEPDIDISETTSTDENYEGGDYVRQSTPSRTIRHHSCVSCCDGGGHSCHHHHHSMSPPRQESMAVATSQQYQPMNVQPLQQRPTGQPIIHQGTNGQPSVIVVPSAPSQPAPPRPPPVHYLVTPPAPAPPPPPPAPQPLIVPMPYPMQQPMMQAPMMAPPTMAPTMMPPPMMQPNMGSYGIYSPLSRGIPAPMDPFYDGYTNFEGGFRRRPSSPSPRRSTRHKQRGNGRRKKKGDRSKSGRGSSSSGSSSSSSSSSSRSSSSSSDGTKGRSKGKKHAKSKKSNIPQAPPPPPPPPKEDTYDVVNQTVRKQRFLSQMPGHRPPPHMETMNRELQERMKAMREGNSNGLKPASRRKLDDTWNASQISSNGADPATEIARLANKFGTAQAS